MKQFFFLFLCTLTISFTGLSQAYESSIQYDKKKQQAIAIDYSYPTEAVQNAIVDKMQQLGYKPKEEKGILNRDRGFLVYKNAYITDISNQRMNYLIKVESIGKKGNDGSTLYLVMNKDSDNGIQNLGIADLDKAKSFLNNLRSSVEAAFLEIQINDQQDVIAKSEKKMKSLKDDQLNLEKKLRDNKSDQESLQKEIEGQKQALGLLMGKRKAN